MNNDLFMMAVGAGIMKGALAGQIYTADLVMRGKRTELLNMSKLLGMDDFTEFLENASDEEFQGFVERSTNMLKGGEVPWIM